MCLLVALSFFPATWGGFVWDDSVWMDPGPVQSPSGLWYIWFDPSSLKNEGHYWPIIYTLLWLEHKLWGFAPLGFHVVNLVLHAGVTLLLWRLLLRLAVPGAWLAAALFAVHPMHVESVVWVIGRKDLLAALFYLGAALLYLRHSAGGRNWCYAGALGLFVLSLLSKSIAVTLPAALLLWHWWQQGRVTATTLRRLLPFVLVALVITVFDLYLYRNRDPVDFGYTLIERLLIAVRALSFYVGKLLWPAELAVIYPRWEVRADDLGAWGLGAAFAAALAVLWLARRRIGRGYLVGALFFVITLLPVLGLVEYGYMKFSFVAERYQYLAGIGLIASLSAAATWGARQLPRAAQAGAATLAAALLAVLGTLSWNQSGIYRDHFSFYSHVAALNPTARFVHLQVGLEHHKQGRLEEALAAYRREHRNALAQQPQDSYRLHNVYLGLGSIAEAHGQLQEAEEYYRKAISFPKAFKRLTALLIRQERYEETLALYQSLLQQNPWSAQLHSGTGIVLLKLQRPTEALQHFEHALSLDPFLNEARIHRHRTRQILQKPSP